MKTATLSNQNEAQDSMAIYLIANRLTSSINDHNVKVHCLSYIWDERVMGKTKNLSRYVQLKITDFHANGTSAEMGLKQDQT